MAGLMVILSYFWFEFMIHYSSLSNYDISSSSNVYIETILKFPDYQWDPRGITNNPNIQKEDVLSNPQLPWIYTEFIQEWVDEEWINSFPYYTERILPKINFVPNFVKQKIMKKIPLRYSNNAIYDAFPDVKVLPENNKRNGIESLDCLVLRDVTDRDFNTDIWKNGINSFCIYGKTNLEFEFVKRYHNKIKFRFNNDVFFVNEYKRIGLKN